MLILSATKNITKEVKPYKDFNSFTKSAARKSEKKPQAGAIPVRFHHIANAGK